MSVGDTNGLHTGLTSQNSDGLPNQMVSPIIPWTNYFATTIHRNNTKFNCETLAIRRTASLEGVWWLSKRFMQQQSTTNKSDVNIKTGLGLNSSVVNIPPMSPCLLPDAAGLLL